MLWVSSRARSGSSPAPRVKSSSTGRLQSTKRPRHVTPAVTLQFSLFLSANSLEKRGLSQKRGILGCCQQHRFIARTHIHTCTHAHTHTHTHTHTQHRFTSVVSFAGGNFHRESLGCHVVMTSTSPSCANNMLLLVFQCVAQVKPSWLWRLGVCRDSATSVKWAASR